MNELAILNNLPKFLQSEAKVADNFGVGLGASQSLPVLSTRGKVFRLRKDAEEVEVSRSGSVEAILVDARPYISKRFFSKTYKPGENSSPDCSSLDGKTPDVGVPNKQSDTCASCPNNIFGSKGAGKACSDYKRVIVMPFIDGSLVTEPALFDFTPTSFKLPRDMKSSGKRMLKEYTAALANSGVSPSMVVTKIEFTGEDYPQVTLSVSRFISEAEYKLVKEVKELPEVLEALHNPEETEEPKLEEPKLEEPKLEEPKLEEPKLEEPKASLPKKQPKVTEPNEEDLLSEVDSMLGEFM